MIHDGVSHTSLQARFCLNVQGIQSLGISVVSITMQHTEIVRNTYRILDGLLNGVDQYPVVLTGKDLTIAQIVFIAR